MARSRAIRKFIIDTCDFRFDFMEIYKEWSLDSILRALDTGQPMRDACMYLELDTEWIEEEVKLHAMRQLYEETSHLTVREIELMTLYEEHTLFGRTLGDLLEELIFMDPSTWLTTFENSILYLNDNGMGAGASPSSSELGDEQKEEIIRRMFGKMPLELDYGPLALEGGNMLHQKWSDLGRRQGAGYRFFRRFVRQDLFLHPHPNDIAKQDRRGRMRQQHKHFQAVLKDLMSEQEIEQDLELYEGELNTCYLEYAAARLAQAGLEENPKYKSKSDALVKIAALFTLVRNSDLRMALLDNLVGDGESGEAPFNLGRESYETKLDYADYKDFFLEEEDVKEGRTALYLIILLIAEFTLKPFLRIKLNEAGLYFGHKGIDASQDIEEGDEEELNRLKLRLIPVVMLRDAYWKERSALLEQYSGFLSSTDPAPDSENLFGSLYKWTYHFNKKVRQKSLFQKASRQLLAQGRHNQSNTAYNLIHAIEPFDQAFKDFANIKPKDLDVEDIDKWNEKF
ncbi:hypothetical protein [Saccharibacillus qingshengii]|uniref:hypothetical protein n=1 Tax=Saccharibacillus qingshengii TaxID=1763540 RepID=UPI001557DC83|nr:hypothetical protein [Saccharibacillus qingshengii]